MVGYDNAGLVAEQKAVHGAGGSLVDVKPWFCTSRTCPVIIGNILVFKDNSHLSEDYASFLGPLVRLEVRRVLASR